jgi:hypothetical protein
MCHGHYGYDELRCCGFKWMNVLDNLHPLEDDAELLTKVWEINYGDEVKLSSIASSMIQG